jgi:hypothetical protein
MFFKDIPDYWSPHEALAIYEFLSDLQQRIWDRYEMQLFELLRSDREQVDDNQPDLFDLNDDIPF